MKNWISKNWILLLILISMISVKFYYLYLSNLNNGSSFEDFYNGSGDASDYMKIAKNIADYNVYSDSDSKIASESATWRPPFWPFVLSVFLLLTTNPLKLILFKSIFELLLLLYILFKFKNLTKKNFIWLLPFCLVFIEPQVLKYSITFLSESLTAILILLLTVYFVSLNSNKSNHIAIPILSSFVILCHPISVFFIGFLFLIYLLLNFKSNFSIALFHGLLFSLLVLAWPLRNYLTFDKGFYMTASQGATFSKGWNENVSTQFTNVQGDLADESLNLKFVDSDLLSRSNNSFLDLSKLYTIGTKNFLHKISFQEKVNIALIKLKSNFNPFPEKPKPVFVDRFSVLFRILYLITFIQMIIRLFKKDKFDFDSMKDRFYLVVLAIFIGQSLMSVYIYTGLRFNSIYALSLLFSFLYLNMDFFNDKYMNSGISKYLKTDNNEV